MKMGIWNTTPNKYELVRQMTKRQLEKMLERVDLDQDARTTIKFELIKRGYK